MRRFAVIPTLAMLLAAIACGTGQPAPVEGPVVTVTGADGPVTIPATDEKIWALDDSTALHLLAIGVVAEHAARNVYQGDQIVTATERILREAGVESAEPTQIEPISAAEPALIIGTNFPGHRDLLPKLTRIAPVLLVDDNKPWDEQLNVLGTATGHSAQASALISRLNNRIATTATELAASKHNGATVSVLSGCGDQVCAYGSVRTFGTILSALGFHRPALQIGPGGGWGYTTLSTERLDSQSAPIIIALTGTVNRGAAPLLTNPILDTTGSITGSVDFGAWYGSGALSVVWILHDLEALLLGRGAPATAAEAPVLWAEVTGS